MALLSEFLGLNRDLPLGGTRFVASASAGSGADYEHILAVVPDLTKLAGSGEVGSLPLNAMTVREVIWCAEANLTGQATNFFTWQVLQKRAGALLVNTTTTTAVGAPGAVTITPAAMTNIAVGTQLLVDVGASAETIVVTVVTATTFTATFANTHSGTWNVVSAPLASVAYSSAPVTETALVPRQVAALAPNVIASGDIITFKRVSSNATGLASPALTVQLDWAPVQGKRPAA
jgi:septal ring-binding cell division protein DamX